jgi:hypothetical protein
MGIQGGLRNFKLSKVQILYLNTLGYSQSEINKISQVKQGYNGALRNGVTPCDKVSQKATAVKNLYYSGYTCWTQVT